MSEAVKSKIPIKNIYYMLTYVWGVLKEDAYSNLSEESFENIYNLLGSVLYRGTVNQIKKGIVKDYIEVTEEIKTIRGKINFSESVFEIMSKSGSLNCTHDEYSSNILLNQILKTTIFLLIKSDKVDEKVKNSLKQLLVFFAEVDEINIFQIQWLSIRYTRNNDTYKMLIDICRLIIDGLIVQEVSGRYKFQTYLKDKLMARVYEKFVYEFYKKHFPKYKPQPQEQVEWDIDMDKNDEFLPSMNTDISLQTENHKLIIDTKFYPQMFQVSPHSEKKTFISGNMYQIYAYVRNTKFNGKVSGMLMYPTVDFSVNEKRVISGHNIYFRTLDLSKDFSDVKQQLSEIVTDLENL